MPRFKELPPFINGFKVIKDLGTFENGKRRYLIAECKVCFKHFRVQRDSLNAKGRVACGCKMHYPHREKQIRTNIPLKLRSIYSGMMARCYDRDHINFVNYGAKGIKVCIKWMNDNNEFFKWALINGYKEGLTLDRINPSQGYYPENCRFITMAENIQSRMSITKLNPEKVKELRNDFNIMTTRAVAKKWNMSHRHIMDIKAKRAWSNVED